MAVAPEKAAAVQPPTEDHETHFPFPMDDLNDDDKVSGETVEELEIPLFNSPGHNQCTTTEKLRGLIDIFFPLFQLPFYNLQSPPQMFLFSCVTSVLSSWDLGLSS